MVRSNWLTVALQLRQTSLLQTANLVRRSQRSYQRLRQHCIVSTVIAIPCTSTPISLARAGFQHPFFMVCVRLVLLGTSFFNQYGRFKNMKARFTGVVLPDQTIITEMWQEANNGVCKVRVAKTGNFAISSATVSLTKAGPTL